MASPSRYPEAIGAIGRCDGHRKEIDQGFDHRDRDDDDVEDVPWDLDHLYRSMDGLFWDVFLFGVFFA